MRIMLKRAGLIVAAAAAAVLTAQAADRRPMTFDDIMAMRAVGSPEIAPDGSAVLYTVRQWEEAKEGAGSKEPADKDTTAEKDAVKPLPRMEARTHIHRVPAGGGAARQLRADPPGGAGDLDRPAGQGRAGALPAE